MGIREMQGTPAHIEYIGPKGGKRRSNCVYYKEGLCRCEKSQIFLLKCVGILLCNYYDDSSETKILLENKRKNIIENLESRCRSCFEDKNRGKRKKQKETHINNRKNRNHPLLNKIITLKCIKFESILEVKIVKKNESNQFQNLFSEKSNFGKAFLNKSIVDKVRLVLGNGYMEYIILKIQ